ncbi:MAG: HAD-IIA family hydrolase [Candidatus Hodarchaeales archaeon]|jgi:4-nitrophenyl phosphatase
MELQLTEKTHIIMDCDGVIWRGNKPIEGSKNALDTLAEAGYHLGFVTNNSSLSREGFSSKFHSLGFNSEDYTIINSGYGAAIYLNRNKLKRIMMIGEKGLHDELKLKNLEIAYTYQADLQAVCIGWDRKLTWTKIADAMWVILKNNAFFMGTNPDNSFPFEDRLVPGAGAGIAALSNACGMDPDIIIGKPNPFLLELAMEEMGCENSEKAVFLGDRLSTDIQAGINANMDTILVQSGVPEKELKKTILPTHTLGSLAEILTLL